jgi:hypothetical protein
VVVDASRWDADCRRPGMLKLMLLLLLLL